MINWKINFKYKLKIKNLTLLKIQIQIDLIHDKSGPWIEKINKRKKIRAYKIKKIRNEYLKLAILIK